MFDQLKQIKELSKVLGNPGDMQRKMDRLQEELERERVEGSSGMGAVKVLMNGKFHVLAVNIDSRQLAALTHAGSAQGVAQDLIAEAINNAIEKAQEVAQKKVMDSFGGLNLAGLGLPMMG